MKKSITVTLPDGTQKVVEGVSRISEAPLKFWREIADALGLPGYGNVACRSDFANCEFAGDKKAQFQWAHKVTLMRGVQIGPNHTDYTQHEVSVDVVRVEDFSA